MQAGTAVFALESDWRPFDVRAGPRLTQGMEAEVRSVLGQSRQPGTIVEVFAEGMAVVVATRPGGRELEVQTRANGYAAHLPCHLSAHSETEDGQVLLRLKFGQLTLPQRAFVRQLLAAAAAADPSTRNLAAS